MLIGAVIGGSALYLAFNPPRSVSAFEATSGGSGAVAAEEQRLKRRPSWAHKFEGMPEEQAKLVQSTLAAADEAAQRQARLQRRPSWAAKFESPKE